MNTLPLKKPSIMSYFLALFLPPVFFLTRKKIVSAIVSAIVCLVSIPFMLLIVGFFGWLAMSAWALWNLRYELMEVHVNRQAQAIAEQLAKKEEA